MTPLFTVWMGAIWWPQNLHEDLSHILTFRVCSSSLVQSYNEGLCAKEILIHSTASDVHSDGLHRMPYRSTWVKFELNKKMLSDLFVTLKNVGESVGFGRVRRFSWEKNERRGKLFRRESSSKTEFRCASFVDFRWKFWAENNFEFDSFVKDRWWIEAENIRINVRSNRKLK